MKHGIAIIYRYDDIYCDVFYVIVDSPVTAVEKTIQFKADGKIHKSYKASDISTCRIVLEWHNHLQEGLWLETIYYFLEPIFNGGKLITTYKNGYLDAYIIDSNGNKRLLFDDKEKQEYVN